MVIVWRLPPQSASPFPIFPCTGWKHHEVSATLWKRHLDDKEEGDGAIYEKPMSKRGEKNKEKERCTCTRNRKSVACNWNETKSFFGLCVCVCVSVCVCVCETVAYKLLGRCPAVRNPCRQKTSLVFRKCPSDFNPSLDLYHSSGVQLPPVGCCLYSSPSRWTACALMPSCKYWVFHFSEV